MKTSAIIFIIALLTSSIVSSQTEKINYSNLGPAQMVIMQVNNINTNFWNDGVFNRYTQSSYGLIWPVSSPSTKTIDFTTGIWIGAKAGPQRELRLAAAFYNSHFSPGNIPVIGQVPPNSVCNDPTWKPYLVNMTDPQLVNGGVRTKIAGGRTFIITYDPWANWPVNRGAPYVEVNNIPGYQPGWNSDRPGIGHTTARPDEISFMVYMDYTNCTNNIHLSELSLPGGTLPLGVEIQQVSFAFLSPGLTDAYFVKWKIINRSSFQWDSTYVSIADDADIGDAFDDAAGCDSTKNIGFVYNIDDDDPIYGPAPPVLGYRLLECPIQYTGNNSDTAHLPYGNFAGFRLLRMSGYNVFINGSDVCKNDPDEAFRAYYYMKGKDGCGNTIINPVTGNPTTFRYNFSNCTPPFWHDSIAGDKRQLLSTGPFTLSPGDHRMLVAAVIAARGSTHYQSICSLMEQSGAIDYFYRQSFGGDPIGVNQTSAEVPERFTLYQNYPNPFNPVTKIKFEIPNSKLETNSKTEIRIYDILGREIKTLVNEQLKPGTYEIEWNAENYPSGVYFYQLTTPGFTQTNKMVLLK